MAEATFPLLGVIESILAWQRDPDEEHRRGVSDALGVLVTRAGIAGAFLEVDIAPRPILGAGWGTLAAGQPVDEPGADHDAHALHAERGAGPRIGTLWLDPAGTAPPDVLRAVELAVEAAWSQAEAHRTTERLEALDAATRGIAGLLSLDRVLQLIVDRVRDLIGADYAALGIIDEDGAIERFVTSGISRTQREAIGPPPRGHGLLGVIIREGRPLRIPDIAAAPGAYGFPPNHPEMHSLLGVPIRVKGRAIGNFYLTNKRHAAEFSEADERLVEMFALHAAVAIENARLHEQVQRMAVVDERVRIGKDLHDGIIQGIYGVGLSLEDVPDLMRDDPDEAVARIDRAIDALNLTIRDIRNFIFGLRPELAGQAGLVAGVAALVNEFRVNSIVDVELDADDDVPDLGEHRRGEVLKIVREALSNIARHAKAARVAIQIRDDRDHVTLTITDNGKGFVVDADRGAEHQGLRNMRTRAADLGGTLDIASTSAGTRVTLRVPAIPVESGAPAGRGGDQ